jgi:hypothetical protein
LDGVRGSIREAPALTVTLAPKVSEPVNMERPAPAPLKVEWPDTCSRMAVIGRTKSSLNFQAQAAMLASIRALPRVKNSFTSSSRVWPRLRELAWAKTAQCPGGNSDCGPSAQYSALILLGSSRLAVSLARLSMSVGDHSPLGSLGGPGTSPPYCEVIPNGTTTLHRQRSLTLSGMLTGW